MRNFLWALAVVIILGGGYLFWQTSAGTDGSAEPSPTSAGSTSPAPAPTPSLSPSEEVPVVIRYTDAGYEPRAVTIKKGRAVRFVNDSGSRETWPASAVHPTHSIYPEKTAADCLGSAFDACKGLKGGESWDFTFNSAGEWRYHDHLRPSKTGTIVVTE